MKIKQLVFFCMALLFSLSSFGQDTTKAKPPVIAVSTNIFQLGINEFSICIEHKFNAKYDFGCTFGRIYYNNVLDPLPLSPSQDKFPGTVYTGFAFRPFIKIYSSHKPASYWSVMLPFKRMWYHYRNFLDTYKGGDYASYNRSENAYVIGVDVLRGHEYKLHHNKLFFGDVFYGLGYRFRQRDINTHSCTMHPATDTQKPLLGKSVRNQSYPVLVLGLRVGINIRKRNPDKYADI